MQAEIVVETVEALQVGAALYDLAPIVCRSANCITWGRLGAIVPIV
jgi:hypothetical protein